MSASLSKIGPHHDIVISTRVRIARNIEGFLFPHRLQEAETLGLISAVEYAVSHLPDDAGNRFVFTRLNHLSQLEQQALVEEHVISPALVSNSERSGFFRDARKGNTIMVNEEDHLRIQTMKKGLALETAWNEADELDNGLGKHLTYAFDETFGYLTACPTNLGTATRVSVMLHLPALTLMGYIGGLIQAAGQLGFAVRGLFGEGSDYLGNLYQISNQITLGLEEQEIISRLEDAVIQVIQKERLARKSLLDNKKIDLEDRIFRSLGILSYARKLTGKEAMQFLSDLKLGTALSLINVCTLDELQELMELVQPAKLQQHYGNTMDEDQRDQYRAQLISQKIKERGRQHVNE